MPSGAKKRKAAKKKMVQQTHNDNPNSSLDASHGDDVLKHYDEKESDGGEVNSPASQDHHNSQHPFTEGEEEEVEKQQDCSSVQLIAPRNDPDGGVHIVENREKFETEELGVVQIEWEQKPEDFESKDINIESMKEVHNGDSSGSSSSGSTSSSSDDESHVAEKKTIAAEIDPAVESVTPAEYFSEELIQVNDSITAAEYNNGAVENGPAAVSVKPVGSLSEGVNEVSNTHSLGENDNGILEPASVVEPDNVPLIEEVVEAIESASTDNNVSSVVGELGLQENAEKILPPSAGYTVVSQLQMNLGSEEKEDELISTSEGKEAVHGNAMDSASEVHEDKLELSFNAPNVHTINGAEHHNGFTSPECSDSQPHASPDPHPVQKTSFKSCCGLFDLFTGSDR